MRKPPVVFAACLVAGALGSLLVAVPRSLAVTPPPTTLEDFILPGSQPGESGNLESPNKCDNCHGGYDQAVEPAFNWRGSMMAQAARDPLFFACLAISNQDAPQAGDLCIRCHTPAGWLGGRSVPTDGSALTASDREGVTCDHCHKMVKPTPLGVNPYPAHVPYTSSTFPQDQLYLGNLAAIPPAEADGMYVDDVNNGKRGPFSDPGAPHQFFPSPFHASSNLCGTCHDVSNPVHSRTGDFSYTPNAFGTPAPDADPHALFPIERTYSEWTQSAYATTPGGIYAPQFGGNKSFVSSCQDCHLRDVSGVACNKASGVHRDDLPLHDMTGGNTLMPAIVGQLHPGEVDAAALAAGIQRATDMLTKAATLAVDVTPADPAGPRVQVRVVNETAHKLPSGYPEGRRIWLNVQAYDTGDQLVYESGAYDAATGVLTHDPDLKLYEIHPGISTALAPVVDVPAGPSFHFVLNDSIYFDNRIPPRGFTNAAFVAIQSAPIGYTYADGQFWDDTEYRVPNGTARVVVKLLYQTTSKEYVEFLRDENRTNDAGTVLYNAWVANGRGAPVTMAIQVATLDVTGVEDPSLPGSRLAIRSARARPDGRIDVRFGLASGATARLTLVDVQGRSVWADDVGPLGAGEHELTIGSAPLAPGVYLLRLAQGGGSATAKVFVRR